MNLNHIGNHIPVRKGIVDAVMPLGNAVTYVCGKIPGSLSARIRDSPHSFIHQLVQMGAARMAVAKCTLNHNLWFVQVLHLPPHADF